MITNNAIKASSQEDSYVKTGIIRYHAKAFSYHTATWLPRVVSGAGGLVVVEWARVGGDRDLVGSLHGVGHGYGVDSGGVRWEVGGVGGEGVGFVVLSLRAAANFSAPDSRQRSCGGGGEDCVGGKTL